MKFLQSVAQVMLTKARMKLNIKRLYAADGNAVKELLKLASLLYKATSKAGDVEEVGRVVGGVGGLARGHPHRDETVLIPVTAPEAAAAGSWTSDNTLPSSLPGHWGITWAGWSPAGPELHRYCQRPAELRTARRTDSYSRGFPHMWQACTDSHSGLVWACLHAAD